MLVTVVTPVTGNPLMRKAIESVQNQTYPDVEHLVVIDGQEREESAKLILQDMELSRHRVIVHCLPRPTGKDGYVGHRIYGMSAFLVESDYVCFLDEDNWYDPDHVESLIKLVTERSLDWAFSLRKIVDRDGYFLCLEDCQSLGQWQGINNETMVDASCFFLRKDVAIKTSFIWYGKIYQEIKIGNKVYGNNPDKALCNFLLEKYPRTATTGLYSVNYRLSGAVSTSALPVFLQGNQIKQQQYPNGFPWRRTKLKDILLPPVSSFWISESKYDHNFYEQMRLASRSSARAILPYLWEILDNKPRSVVDIGCGTGSWLAEAQALFGITDILGIDGDHVEATQLEIPESKFRRYNLAEPLPIPFYDFSTPQLQPVRFDIVFCLEVAEHLPSDVSDSLVFSLTQLGDLVLFSAAIPCQPGTNHINCQFPHYWVNLFAKYDYQCVDCLREKFWSDERVAWWYAQNLLLFVNQNVLRENTKLQELHSKTDLDRLVRIHPKNVHSKVAFGHDDTVDLKIVETKEKEKEASPTISKLHQELLYKFYEESPYENFPYTDYDFDVQGWGSNEPIFERLISELSPQLIIELGSWKGASALHMVELLRQKNLICPVLCVDTWLGTIESAVSNPNPNCYVPIPRSYGFPTLYYQFLANVMYKGAENYIVPIPMHSTGAFKLFKHWQVLADLVYIDGSHEEEDVYADLSNYWQLLKSGGIVLLDDYDPYSFPGVFIAVQRFARRNSLPIHVEGRKCFLVKTPSLKEEVESLKKRVADLEDFIAMALALEGSNE